MPSFDLVAHRGYPRRFPDNSLTGIRAALAAGARHLEIDVQLSASGTAWLFHDASLERVTGCSGSLVELSDDEIGALRASEQARLGEAFADEPVASLKAVVAELARRPEVFTFVEIKPVALERHGVQTVVEAVAGEIQGLTGRVAVISFSLECLRAVRRHTTHPIGSILTTYDQHASLEHVALSPEYVFCDVERLPATGPIDVGARLAVYEVVDPELAASLGERGAEFVETFAYPEMHDALEQLGA